MPREISSLVWPGVVTLVLTLALTPVFRSLFHKWGLLDLPDEARRIHSTPTPRVGGMAIASSLLIAFLLLCFMSPFPFHYKQLEMVGKMAPSAIVILGTGILDDVIGLRAWQKLVGQIVAAGMACYSGIVLMGGWWAAPLSILWLMACTNGFNLIDGMDGLAGGAGLIAALTIAFGTILQGDIPLAVVVLALAGALIGFLRYNLYPATVFLGDSGSLFLGFVLGSAGIMWARAISNQAGLLAPALVLSVPLLDTGLAILRRAVARRPIFSADLGHVHHRLLNRKMSPSRAAITLYGMSALMSLFGVVESTTGEATTRAFILFLYCAMVAVGAGYLGYFRFPRRQEGQAGFISAENILD